jgi:hypothetical protein
MLTIEVCVALRLIPLVLIFVLEGGAAAAPRKGRTADSGHNRPRAAKKGLRDISPQGQTALTAVGYSQKAAYEVTDATA